ncbi:putative eukaryotic translation initiation factor 4G [Rhizoctonia solani 123E]|uniref:Putative eukaryotic translation initiation factor 4G n=1 Tax=Rhizoctonia solani 123E TaxID=1423351 RepID=A0A074RUM7_9AGAM|nr:putative eukaryotic translation initiation factor 4G [Rhizoctonia solani 123E]
MQGEPTALPLSHNGRAHTPKCWPQSTERVTEAICAPESYQCWLSRLIYSTIAPGYCNPGRQKMPRPSYSDEAIEAKKRDSREKFEAELGLRPKNVKNIEDLETTRYPSSVDPPDLELCFPIERGRFRYHRSFLLQFKDVCKEKPASLRPLDVIGFDPGAGVEYIGGRRSDKRRIGSLGMNNVSTGLGLGAGLANRSGFAMGNFQSPSTSQSRFEASNPARASGMTSAGGASVRNQRGKSRKDTRNNPAESDGWSVTSRVGVTCLPPQAGDLSQFGRISKPTGIQFGPSSVFKKKDTSNRHSSTGRAGVVNMSSALSTGAPLPVERAANSHEPSAELEASGISTGAGGRKLNLLPRVKPPEDEDSKADDKEQEREDVVPGKMAK